MAKYRAILESRYYGADEEFEFEAPDDASDEEIDKIAYETVMENIQWHWEKMTNKEKR